MKIYVICDLEGVAGVVDYRQQCSFGGEYYSGAREQATMELNALVEGAIDGGATEIVAWDGHGNFPGGIDSYLLHNGCRLILGGGEAGPVGLDESFDVMMLLGLHAMCGKSRAVLAHSFFRGLDELSVNGVEMGEVGLNMLTAGWYGIPTIFISGDKAAIDEASALVQGITCAVVKEGISETPLSLDSQSPCISLSGDAACDLIREKSLHSVISFIENRSINHEKSGNEKSGLEVSPVGMKTVQPFIVKPPFHVRVRFSSAEMAAAREDVNNARLVDDFTLEYTVMDPADIVI
ncbi:MAG: hypothetical protein CVV64_14265 [Candidatus Wallbacteria bacterium HGW-Wallbacteria-1]|jgi:D-amino peptidase|uniref:Peptidase M55 n=1 Tax=Candidatus Wallbacteria bacterium HGW-Wallbacteria-1 TaxID=2013854 RepID=A0A2N1PM76_9BACT|nr:MAG: hypothetical protein CVV64_14265 [Candidatus Wallbacteria bacterium HGW-Wallbacteria-1]